ncbi:uncharacterized protein FOKN1_0557 [Thiohalobacter thiocyanaticus]|uniref:Uncharacterized protein n=1 Tax=Thiohalobacter thiocyanaticus TaxID=585455 RepID=A0A1Z4VMW9_9GAMM|nr:uncharacterized protein FOKN1_0557 [Thiohalobacter thiocyanaticus]
MGDEPTTFDSRHAHAGVAHRFGDYNLRLGGTFEALDYDSVGPLNNDDRDRDLIGLGARLGYEFHPDYEAYVQLVRDIRSYNDPVDDFGYQCDSDGERIAVGFKGRFTNRLQGGAYVGWIRQAWDDSRFNDLSTPDFSGALSFRATPRTTVSAAVDRSLEETTLPGASGYLYTEASVNAVHRLDSRTRFSAGHGRGDRGRGGAKGGRGVHDFARGGGRSVEVKVFRGQRPVWAQEGIPEVELGRLNVSRAPAHVLARHEDEALARYSTEMAALYNLPADAAAQLLQTAYGETPRLDSPLQNLAMYEQVMVFGRTELEGIQAASAIDLAAIFLGTAADKNLPITEDTIIALNRILGLKEMPAYERAALASRANTVREAILIGHGPETDH